MASIFRKKRNLVLLAIGCMVALFITVGPKLSVISNYQGLHPGFAGIYVDGVLYTNENPGNASLVRIHSSNFNFDVDGDDTGLPNLRGELRDIMIIKDMSTYAVGDVTSHIISMGGTSGSPYKTYTWEVADGNNTRVYKMENYLTSMEINLWAEPDVKAWYKFFQPVEKEGQYQNLEVWLKLETGPGWYYETDPPDELYFGLGYIELAELTILDGHYNPLMEVMPESRWAAFPIYESLSGQLEQVASPVAQAKNFKGTRINPEVFADAWYIPITLDNFGSFDHNLIDGSYNTDSIQLKVLVHVFVIGEWVVQPLEEERDMEEHKSSEKEGWIGPLIADISNTLKNPWFKGYLAAIPLIIIFAYFGPRWIGLLTKKRSDA